MGAGAGELSSSPVGPLESGLCTTPLEADISALDNSHPNPPHPTPPHAHARMQTAASLCPTPGTSSAATAAETVTWVREMAAAGAGRHGRWRTPTCGATCAGQRALPGTKLRAARSSSGGADRWRRLLARCAADGGALAVQRLLLLGRPPRPRGLAGGSRERRRRRPARLATPLQIQRPQSASEGDAATSFQRGH